MTTTIVGLLIAYLIITLAESIKIPGARKIQVIMYFGKFRTVIANVEGKRILKPGEIKTGHETWDLVDLEPGEKNGINIHFFLWPLFKTYKYPLTYTKAKKIGEEKKGDVVIWKDETTKECIIARTGVSNFVEFRVEYPTITPKLDTAELATVHTFTNNILEVVNVVKMLFGINDYMKASTEILNGSLKGLVSNEKLANLNKLSKEDGKEFDEIMKEVNRKDDTHPGLLNFGMKLYKSVFKDFDPADDKTIKLMGSYADVVIAEQEGKAALKKQKGVTAAFILDSNAKIEQEKKRRVQNGLAKVDSNGNIYKLVPEADTEVIAENLGKLSNTKGTVVLDSGIGKMLNIKGGGNE
ncbi:MAG: hypothetical protein WA101_01625 [Minisyncoccia bacterium]